jgi:repressor LexA
MKEPTPRQQQILSFIETSQRDGGETPSLREIARHFRFKSMTAARDHVQALVSKGRLRQRPGRARALQVLSPLHKLKRPVADIPLFGAIPAGFADPRNQQAEGCLSVDVETLGIRPNARTFALQVQGDSMIGRHILDGDYVICMHGITPRPGHIVAALIDNESTLKTYVLDRGRPYLKAENPRYPRFIPAAELVIQGIVVAILRKLKPA